MSAESSITPELAPGNGLCGPVSVPEGENGPLGVQVSAGALGGRVAASSAQSRLARIAEAHSKHVTAGGMTSGDCNECGWSWPCPTWTWATTDRDPLATWNPDDDEEADQ